MIPSDQPLNDTLRDFNQGIGDGIMKLPDLYDVFKDCPEVYPGKFDSDENTIWFATTNEDSEIIGVVNAQERGPGVWYFGGSITLPEYRRRGIWRRLHEMRTKYAIEAGARVLLVVSSPMNRQVYEDEGWIPMTHDPYHERFDEVVYFRCVGND